jgi:protein-tyrosine phosphatase
MSGSLARWFSVVEPRVLGGEHPCPGGDARLHAHRLDALLALGVTTFVDLTERGENGIEPYARRVRQRAGRDLPVSYHAFPIRDASVPRDRAMVERLLDTIDVALANDETVYLHCRSGVGRTGTVLALHLVRHGRTPAQALREVQRAWRRDVRSGVWPYCPQTEGQRRYVLDTR